MTRVELPLRRRSATSALRFKGKAFTVTFGFDDSGRPKEAFADGARGGSELANTISDACVLISISLQHGIAPEALGKSLGREPDHIRGANATLPASIIGVIVAALLAEVRDG